MLLTMEVWVTSIARLVFFLLHQVRQLSPYWSCLDLTTVIYAKVTSKLDYYNLLSVGLPMTLT